jgi:hypothetical protein
MTAKVTQGTVVFRHWDESEGLSEIVRNFTNLTDLYAQCLQKNAALLVDRIIIEGVDENDAPHTVTLVFQSVTVAPGDGS